MIAGIPSIELIPSWAIILLIVWTIPWKGLALWKCAKNNQKIWFMIFMVVNTVGILEMLYIAFWARKKRK